MRCNVHRVVDVLHQLRLLGRPHVSLSRWNVQLPVGNEALRIELHRGW
jgi:hypothetical protein